jgi:TetR/AcrR family transcriptional regulator, transcriptional repressor for nem operon
MVGRKEEAAGVRKRIIEASIKQFLAKGFVGTSVTDLAEAVGIAKGTVYCHFKSKDEILESVLDKFSTEFLDSVIREVNSCEGDFLKKFRTFYKYTTEFGQNHRELMLVWHTLLGEIIGNRSEPERRMKEIQDRYNRFLEAFLEEGKGQGLIGPRIDTRIYSRIITATLTGMLLQWYVESPSIEDSRQYARSFRDVIMKGLEAVDLPSEGSTV